MDKDARIRDAQIRFVQALEKHPKLALNTYRATAVIEDGFICRFSQEERSAVMDMPKSMGGDDAGPTPGFFARAGIAGCVSMGIKQLAVRESLVVDSIAVDIETDFDDGATLGAGESSAAPLETRLSIRVETEAAESDVIALVDRVLATDPWYLALRDAQTVRTRVTVER